MGAFEDGDFIIVGLDPDAAQSRFSTLSPSGFPEHHKRCLSSCVCVCVRMTLSWNMCKSWFFPFEDATVVADLCFGLDMLNCSIFDSFVPIWTITRELQSYLYTGQEQVNVRKSGFLCKTSALLCDLVPKYNPGKESFYYLTPVCDSAVSLTEESKRKLFICCHCLLVYCWLLILVRIFLFKST